MVDGAVSGAVLGRVVLGVLGQGDVVISGAVLLEDILLVGVVGEVMSV